MLGRTWSQRDQRKARDLTFQIRAIRLRSQNKKTTSLCICSFKSNKINHLNLNHFPNEKVHTISSFSYYKNLLIKDLTNILPNNVYS